MIDYSEVGNRIRYYRRKNHITQEQLAFEMQTSAAYLSNIERGIKKPSLQKLIEIADALGVSVEDLLSSHLDLRKRESEDANSLLFVCTETDKRRIVNNLLEVINILEKNSRSY